MESPGTPENELVLYSPGHILARTFQESGQFIFVLARVNGRGREQCRNGTAGRINKRYLVVLYSQSSRVLLGAPVVNAKDPRRPWRTQAPQSRQSSDLAPWRGTGTDRKCGCHARKGWEACYGYFTIFLFCLLLTPQKERVYSNE